MEINKDLLIEVLLYIIIKGSFSKVTAKLTLIFKHQLASVFNVQYRFSYEKGRKSLYFYVTDKCIFPKNISNLFLKSVIYVKIYSVDLVITGI